ncbi:MAG: energy-coupling factor transporter transmembrane protein EcfT [Treponema sp.]|jgi:cobalt/nickel transport system permease protein|nr:energy-coupling factor transporter transmembrane protein EcfT [Treponema sp.]
MYLNQREFKHDILRPFDPRCRLAAGCAVILSAVSVTNPLLLAGLIIAAALALVRDIRTVLTRLGAVNVFCATLFITMPLSGYGIEAPLRYTLRINAAAVIFMLFVASPGTGGIAPALTKLRVNAKLVSLLILTCRYVVIMHDRVFRAVLSMRLRRPRMGTLTAWRSYTALFASAFAGAFFRSQKISRAARARGFDGLFPLTRTFNWKLRDTAALIIASAVSILLVYLDKNLGQGLPWRIYR